MKRRYAAWIRALVLTILAALLGGQAALAETRVVGKYPQSYTVNTDRSDEMDGRPQQVTLSMESAYYLLQEAKSEAIEEGVYTDIVKHSIEAAEARTIDVYRDALRLWQAQAESQPAIDAIWASVQTARKAAYQAKQTGYESTYGQRFDPTGHYLKSRLDWLLWGSGASLDTAAGLLDLNTHLAPFMSKESQDPLAREIAGVSEGSTGISVGNPFSPQ